MIYICIFIAIIGFFPFAISVYKMKRTSKMKSNGLPTTAVVRELYGDSVRGINRVLIEYRTAEGMFISKQIFVGGMPYSVGQSLPVYYDANDPYNMVLDPGKTYIGILIFTLLVAAFMIFAAFQVYELGAGSNIEFKGFSN